MSHPRSLLALAFLIAAAVSSPAATLLTEHFPIKSGNVAQHTWQAYHSSNATDITNIPNPSATTAIYRAGTLPTAGAADLPTTLPANAGYLFAQSYARSEPGAGAVTTPATNYFLFTTSASKFTSPTALSSYSTLQANWQQSGSPASTGVRFAMQLNNGQWYVSTVLKNNGSTNGYVPQSENLLTATWFALNFASGTSLSVNSGTPLNLASLVGTNITGFGFYIDSLPAATTNSGSGTTATESFITMRLDQLVVTGDLVPEPSRAILLGLAGIGLLLRRQRKLRIHLA